MEEKKSKKSNLESKRITFVLIGFVVVLALVFILLEWGKKEPPYEVQELTVVSNGKEVEVLLPVTFPSPPKSEPAKTAAIPVDIQISNDGDGGDDPEISSSDDNGDPIDFPQGGTVVLPDIIDLPDDSIIMFPAEMPEPSVNLGKYFSKAIRYPTIPAENGIQGRVVVNFVIEKDGSISNVKIMKSVDTYLDKEAIRVVQAMPKWKPGKQNNKPVRVAYIMPIVFQLKKE